MFVLAPATRLKSSFTFVAISPTGKTSVACAKTAMMAAATALTDLPTEDSEIQRLSPISRRWAPVATNRRNSNTCKSGGTGLFLLVAVTSWSKTPFTRK